MEHGDVGRILSALRGDHGAGQQRIAEKGVDMICLLLRKNSDYGGTVFQPPLLAPTMESRSAILVRMSDKVGRIHNLMKKGTSEVNESIGDSIWDLGGYSIL